MTEIRKNPEVGKFQQPQKTSKQEEVPAEKMNADVEKGLENFLNPTAEAIGRAHVNNTESTDAIQQDMMFLIKNPKAVEQAEKFFDNVYPQLLAKGYSPEEAYVEAGRQTKAFIKEFSSQ